MQYKQVSAVFMRTCAKYLLQGHSRYATLYANDWSLVSILVLYGRRNMLCQSRAGGGSVTASSLFQLPSLENGVLRALTHSEYQLRGEEVKVSNFTPLIRICCLRPTSSWKFADSFDLHSCGMLFRTVRASKKLHLIWYFSLISSCLSSLFSVSWHMCSMRNMPASIHLLQGSLFR